MTEKEKRSMVKQYIGKIFNEPNILKILPILLIPTIIVCLINIAIVTYIMPGEIKDIVGLNNYGSVIIAVVIMILVRLIYKNSLYFKISLSLVLLVAVAIVMTRVNSLLGDLAVESSVGEFLIQSVPSGIFIALIVFYVANSIQQPLRILMSEVQRVSKGDLSSQSSISYINDYGSEFANYGENFTAMIQNISQIVAITQKTVEKVKSSSEELAATSEEVNALTEEIAATIQQVSRGASSQSEYASRGIVDIKKMSETVDQSLQDIETTLKVIDDIAGQTNILSLNAAIESARAGEYGRGFAVVADNVRRLAEETKNNSADINRVTDAIVANLGNSIKGLEDTLQGFSAQSEEFSASSEEVAAATEEQTAAMHQLTRSAQELTKLSEELAAVIMQFNLKN